VHVQILFKIHFQHLTALIKFIETLDLILFQRCGFLENQEFHMSWAYSFVRRYVFKPHHQALLFFIPSKIVAFAADHPLKMTHPLNSQLQTNS